MVVRHFNPGYKMAFKALRSLLFTLFLALVFSSCTENPVDLNRPLYKSKILGALQDTVLYPVRDTTYVLGTRYDTQFSNQLLLGKYRGIEARPIIRFTNLPQNAQFTGITIRFATKGVMKDGTAQPFTVTAYPILQSWKNNLDSVWNDYTQNFDANRPFGTMEVSTSGSDTLFMPLNDSALVQFTAWADSAALQENVNFGIILDFTEANFLKAFKSLNISDDPSILCTYQVPGDTAVHQDTITATFDAFLYQGTGPQVGEQHNLVSSLIAHIALLQYDIKGFYKRYPDGVVFVSANLEVPFVPEDTQLDHSFGNSLRVSRVLSDFDSSHVRLDSSYNSSVNFTHLSEDSSSRQVRPGEDRKIFAGYILQKELEIPNTRNTLAIVFGNLRDHYSFFTFYKRQESDPTLLPRLRIVYWIPPGSRFD